MESVEAAADFLRQHIIGRQLITDELIYSLENGQLEGVYSDRMVFSRLVRSDRGLGFDLSVVSKEKIYAKNADGGRGELRKNFSSSSVFRYELALRHSTGEITGHMRFLTASLPNVPAEAMASLVKNVRLVDNALVWQEREIIYRDQPAADGGYCPVAFEADCRVFHRDGKAVYEYNGVCMDVNPENWERTPSASVFPVFMACEK